MPTSPAPQHCPAPRELDDLELLLSGALAPIDRFNEPGSPVTLTLPAELDGAPRSSWSTRRAFPSRAWPRTGRSPR